MVCPQNQELGKLQKPPSFASHCTVTAILRPCCINEFVTFRQMVCGQVTCTAWRPETPRGTTPMGQEINQGIRMFPEPEPEVYVCVISNFKPPPTNTVSGTGLGVLRLFGSRPSQQAMVDCSFLFAQ